VRELLERLVVFDTTSAKPNLALIDFVRSYLDGQGVTSTLTPSSDGNKASLFATIGKQGEGGIGLSGHSDCVPVEGRRGQAIHSSSPSATASFTVAVPVT
jgi:acetylornithine deacetylase